MGTLRGLIRLVLFIALTAFLVPLQVVYGLVQKILSVRPVRQAPLVRLWYKGVAFILGLKITVQGLKSHDTRHQSLYISNHSSYLDIVALGSCLPPFFVAKSDTADWPVFGTLIRIGGTLFISRKRSALPQQMKLIHDALVDGKSLLLFPEGTTSDGLHILPFKSSLLNVLYKDMGPVAVTPVCIRYQSVNKRIFTDDNKDLVSWYGDGPDFAPHLWTLAKQRSVAVRIDVLPAVISTDYPDAKNLTHDLKLAVTDCFTRVRPALSGKMPK